MISLTPKTILKAYLMLILLAAMLISPPPYSIVALILLILQVYLIYRPLRAELSLALAFSVIILTPLTLEPSAGKLFSTFLMIPALPLLDQSLRENALNQFFGYSKGGRKFTTIMRALATTLLLVCMLSLLLLNEMLMLTSILLTGYLAIVLAYIFYKIPKMPLEESKTWSRVVVGDTIRMPITLKGKANVPFHVLLEPSHSWIRLKPSKLMLAAEEKEEINLVVAPPLAGPSKPQLQALAIDPWGLTQISQVLEPVELHIIPRARYAEWLARKYLEQTAPGTIPAAAIPPLRALRAAKRGVEYYGSRLYQPGDRLRDLDWKHTFKLQELIVKEFVGAHGQPAIIAANLTAKDPEEADGLAYNLVTSALTLAREAAPTALAAYNHEEALAMTPPTNPREALRRTLRLTRSITLIKPLEKTLQPLDVQRLRRSISQLEQAKTEPAQKLAGILKMEYEAIQEAAGGHPASQTLRKTAESTPPPALITVVSSWSHDAEALAITLEKLKGKGYNAIPVGARTHTQELR